MRPHVVSWLESFLPGNVAALVAPTWFTCVGLAGVVTLFLMLVIARRHRIDPGVVASIVLTVVLATPAGLAIGQSQKWNRRLSALIYLTYPIPKVVFLPIILAYTAWVYKVLWGKVSSTTVQSAGSSAY